MSSRVPAHIFIGGDVPHSLLPVLFKAVHAEEVGSGMDYNGRFTPEQFITVDDLLEEVNHNQYLHLMDSKARNGMLGDLEYFLQNNNISFNRYGDASPGEFSADVSFFRPGMTEVGTLITDDDGVPVIPASAAVIAFKALLVGNTHAALTALAPFGDHEVPLLPPFKLVDGVE